MKMNDSYENNSYELVDSGDGSKLERFGAYLLDRPCSQAIWKKSQGQEFWKKAHARFERESETRWKMQGKLPESWVIEVEGIRFTISPTDFGHLGIFPEQKPFWKWIQDALQKEKKPMKVLNLFAYSGGSTMAAALGKAEVCHLDASKGMVSWARENAVLNGLEKAPIRWIIDDVQKFLQREIKRQNFYDAIILDPPTFGRGSKLELFKIEQHIVPLLEMCRKVMKEKPLFVLFSCHTPGFSPTVMQHLVQQNFGDLKGTIDSGEMQITGQNSFSIPSGTWGRWYRE